MANGMKNMGFPKANAAIEKKRVIGFTRILCHRHPGGLGESVGGTNDKTVECILWIKLFAGEMAFCFGGRDWVDPGLFFL